MFELTLNMNQTKTNVISSIRRLMEKLPIAEPLNRITSETEAWCTYVGPIVDSLLSSPEEGVHLRWTNQKNVENEPERPNCVISVMSQSNWARSIGYGEAKIAQDTENYHVLSWDLCDLGYFSKSAINNDDTKSIFLFQSKGHMITFYTAELAYDGLYVMTQLSSVNIPKSVADLDHLTTRQNLKKINPDISYL